MNEIRRYQGKNILRHEEGDDYAVKVDIGDAEISLQTNDPLPVDIQNEVVTVAGEVTIDTTYGPVNVHIEAGDNNIGNVDTSEVWRVSLQAEETADDSDKTFTVPASTEWQILSIWIELATSADVGARQITVEMQDSAADVIGQFKAGATQAASLTYTYMFAPGLELMNAVSGTYLSFPLPPMFLPAGYKVRVYDSAAVDAAADDMVVRMMIASRTV